MLKALLQLMVCSAVGRSMVYYALGDEEFRLELLNMFKYLCDHNITVGMLWSYLVTFKDRDLPASQLYTYIREQHINSNSVNLPGD